MEQKCVAITFDREIRGLPRKCDKPAGYGPDKKYCKIHARSRGELIGETITLYRVMDRDWKGDIRFSEAQAEVSDKLYRLSGKDWDFDYVKNLPKERCRNKGIFTTKEEALAWFVKRANQRVDIAIIKLKDAEGAHKETMEFAQKSGVDWISIMESLEGDF